jgi:hypothetical protein
MPTCEELDVNEPRTQNYIHYLKSNENFTSFVVRTLLIFTMRQVFGQIA